MFTRYLFVSVAVFAFTGTAYAQPDAKADPTFTRKEDVVYGRRDGLALTLDVFSPKEKPNGAGVIMCVSAEFKSSKDMLNQAYPLVTPEFLKRGYVVFMVTHGSQ